jgi:16S rRNA C967 or C1407 C5-methylase (RsmB/RsmF family)
MEWLFDRRGKSVAQSAQRVVADMHRHLEKQNKKVSELESVITQFNKLFTDSLENDLSRLELRRKELAAEMLTVDTAIAERRNRLQNVREEIYQILAKNEADLNNNSRSLSLNGTSLDHSQNGNEKGMTIAETRASALEEQYLEESEMLATIKDLGHDILFVVHRYVYIHVYNCM